MFIMPLRWPDLKSHRVVAKNGVQTGSNRSPVCQYILFESEFNANFPTKVREKY